MRNAQPNAAGVGAFWFGIQMLWGALLGISLQARASEFVPHDALAAYSFLAISGACVAAVTQIISGIVSDRRRAAGSRRIEFYVTGAAIGAAAILWFYLAPEYAQLVAAFVVLQFGMNIAIGPYQAAIPDFFEEKVYGTASAWMAALQSLGNAAGAIAAIFIKSAAATGAAIAGALVIGCAISAAHVKGATPITLPPQRLRVTKAFTDLFISRALVYLGFYTLLGYLFFYVKQVLQSDAKTQTGMLLLLFLIASAIGAGISARRIDRVDRRMAAVAGGAAFIVALVVFLFARHAPLVACAAFIAGAGWGIFLTADWALGCTFMPRGALATAMGIWNLALLIPQIAAPAIVFGALNLLHATQSGDAPRIAFVLAALEVAVGLAWLGRLPASRAAAV